MAPAPPTRPTAYPKSRRALGARQDAAQAPVQELPAWLTWSLTTVALPTPTPNAQGVKQRQAVFSVAVVDSEALQQVQPTQTYCGPSIPLGPGWVDCTASAAAPTLTQGSMESYPFVSDQSGFSTLDPWADYPYATAPTQAPLPSDAYYSPGETVLTATSSQATETLMDGSVPTASVVDSAAVPTATYQPTSTFTMPTAVPTGMAISSASSSDTDTVADSTSTPSAISQAAANGIRPATIVAASLGGFIVVLLLSIFVFLLCRRRRNSRAFNEISTEHEKSHGGSSALSPTAATLAAGNRWNTRRKPPPSPLSLNDTAFHRDFCCVPEAGLSVPELLPPATGTLYVVNADHRSQRDSVTTYEQRMSLPREQLVLTGVGAGAGYGAGVAAATGTAAEQGGPPQIENWHARNDRLPRGSSESTASMCSSLLPPPRPLASRAVVSSTENDEERLAHEHHAEPRAPTSAQELTFQQRWDASSDPPGFKVTAPTAPRSADSIYTVYGGAPLTPPVPLGATAAQVFPRGRATAAVWPMPRAPARPLRAAARATPTAPTSWHRGMGAHTSSSSGEEVVQTSPETTRGESERSFSSTDSSGQRTSVNALSSLFSRRSFDSITRSFIGAGGAREREGDLEQQQTTLPPRAEAAGWSVTPEAQERHVRFNAMTMQPSAVYRDSTYISFDGFMHHSSSAAGAGGAKSPPDSAEQWSTVDIDSGAASPSVAAAGSASKLGVPRFPALPKDVTPLSRLGQSQPRPSLTFSASDGAENWSTQDSWESRTPAPHPPSLIIGGSKRSRDSGEQWPSIDVDSYVAPPRGPSRPLDMSPFGFLRNDTLRNDAAPARPPQGQLRASVALSASDGAEVWSTQDSWQSRSQAPAPAPACAPLPTTPALNVRKANSHARSDSSRSTASTGSSLSTDMVRAHLWLSEAEENDLLPQHA